MLLNNGVPAENLVRDLLVLERSEEVIEERLEIIKRYPVERIMPWMIKCEEHVLMRLAGLHFSMFHFISFEF